MNEGVRTQRLERRAENKDVRARVRGPVLHGPSDPNDDYPVYAARADGAHLWDVDGRRFTDFLLGYGPVILGHNDSRVNGAVISTLTDGGANCMAPLWPQEQVVLCEVLSRVIPGAEAAFLLKTGSDATSAAVRAARVFTGREIIISRGYNGWHDWAVRPSPGVPEGVRRQTHRFEHTDDGIEEAVAAAGSRLAAIITTPFGNGTADVAQLNRLADAAHQVGALFILDEMRSGFRLSLGGAQAALDVRADMVTFSKALANGFAISALTGRKDVLDSLSETKVSSTFFASRPEMAAAIATIDVLETSDALITVDARGTQLLEGMQRLAKNSGLRVEAVGYPQMPFLNFDDVSMAERFSALCARDGVLVHPSHQWFVSASHTVDDVDHALDVMRSAVDVVRRA